MMTPKILIADDEKHLVGWLADALTHSDCQVEILGNEQDIRRALGAKKYSLIILDIMIATDRISRIKDVGKAFQDATVTGLRICRYIREELKLDSRKLPILIWTIRGEKELIAKAAAYTDYYFLKGLDEDALLACISRTLSKRVFNVRFPKEEGKSPGGY